MPISPIEAQASPLYYLLWMSVYVALAGALSRTSWFASVVPATSQASFNAPLEGLRGILALSVFFHHVVINQDFLVTGSWDQPSSRFYHHCGITSVTLFFFLTGYLFWTKLRDGQRLQLGRFYLARVRRLTPAYLGSLVLILGIVAIRSGFAVRVPLLSLGGSILKWCVYGLPEGHFPDVNGVRETLLIDAGVVWTLRFEWMFYLVLPFLAWFARGQRFLFLGVTIIPALLPRERLFAWSERPVMEVILSFFFFFGLGFFPGIVTAQLVRLKGVRAFAKQRLVAVVPALSLLGYVLFAPPDIGPRAFFLLIPFVLIAAGVDPFGLLSSRPLQFLGRISYSVYLLHGICLTATSSLLRRYADVATLQPSAYWLFAGATGAIAVLVSTISYRLLEEPFLRAKG